MPGSNPGGTTKVEIPAFRSDSLGITGGEASHLLYHLLLMTHSFMSFAKISKLANKFIHKLAQASEEAIGDKLSDIVSALAPFVADNSFHEQEDHYEVVIEVTATANDTEEDHPDLSDDEFATLIKHTAELLKTTFNATDISTEDTSHTYINSDGEKVVAVKAIIAK